MKHKNSEVIKAFVDGIECEYWCVVNNEWCKINRLHTLDYFSWDFDVRIKPEPKPDLIDYVKVDNNFKNSVYIANIFWAIEKTANLKLVWDGETGKLKSAKVIKNV